jgi:hypothetical protein
MMKGPDHVTLFTIMYTVMVLYCRELLIVGGANAKEQMDSLMRGVCSLIIHINLSLKIKQVLKDVHCCDKNIAKSIFYTTKILINPYFTRSTMFEYSQKFKTIFLLHYLN